MCGVFCDVETGYMNGIQMRSMLQSAVTVCWHTALYVQLAEYLQHRPQTDMYFYDSMSQPQPLDIARNKLPNYLVNRNQRRLQTRIS